MTDNTIIDAAILHVVNQQRLEAGQEPISELSYAEQSRKFVGGVIAKLLEGTEEPITAPIGSIQFQHHHGYNAALTEIRRRAGIEGGES